MRHVSISGIRTNVHHFKNYVRTFILIHAVFLTFRLSNTSVRFISNVPILFWKTLLHNHASQRFDRSCECAQMVHGLRYWPRRFCVIRPVSWTISLSNPYQSDKDGCQQNPLDKRTECGLRACNIVVNKEVGFEKTSGARAMFRMTYTYIHERRLKILFNHIVNNLLLPKIHVCYVPI